MKIYIHEPEEEKDIRLTIPNGVIFNKLGAMIAGKVIEENTQENTITKEQLKRLMKEIKRYVKQFGHFDLVDIETSDGEIIKITL
jgi:dipeptidase